MVNEQAYYIWHVCVNDIYVRDIDLHLQVCLYSNIYGRHPYLYQDHVALTDESAQGGCRVSFILTPTDTAGSPMFLYEKNTESAWIFKMPTLFS